MDLTALAGTAPDLFVRRTLAGLEAELREMALLALADWDRCALVVPDLFRAVAALQRPAWGHWNGLLTGLREARKSVWRAGAAAERERIKQALVLEAVLEFLDREAGPERARLIKPLAELTTTPLPRKPRLGSLIALPISLRNLVAHFAPTDPAWWQRAAQALLPLAEWQRAGELRPAALHTGAFPAPWFWSAADAGPVWPFNGLRDEAVLYASPAGEPHAVPDMMRPVLLAFQRLLGKTDVQEDNLKRLLTKLAPEDLKGVLLGDYLVGRPVGSGGYATVHVGTQLSTGRKVAVKVLHDGMTEDARARFQQEAVFLSRLSHPHIVGILGYGEDAWAPPREPTLAQSLAQEEWFRALARSAPVKSYLVMEWIEGRTLEEVYCADRPDQRTLTGWFVQAAQALGAVHGAGLIHRDVKPGNLMVTEAGTIKLMDFGIARTRDEIRTVVTTPDRALGTPAYMAPEQIGARDGDSEVGPACDIYALCATFYELCTGTRLFHHDRETIQSVEQRKLRGQRPERPRRLACGLSWELETILMGGLEPGLSERYRSMGDLERDLRHCLRDEPIEYRRPALLRRFRLWHRRNPWVANLLGLVFTLLVAIVIVLGVGFLVITAARDAESEAKQQALGLAEKERQAKEKQKEATKAKTDALDLAEKETWRRTRQWYASAMNLADREWKQGNPFRVLELLEGLRPEHTGGKDLRGWEWHYQSRLCQGEQRALRGHMDVRCVAVSPDGSLLASGSEHGSVMLWDVATGKILHTLWAHRGKITGIAFSPDGTQLASGGPDRLVKLWDVANGTEICTLTGHKDPVGNVAFSRDGRLLASAGSDAVRIWDLAARTQTQKFDGYVRRVAFHPDGRQVAWTTGNFVKLGDVASGKELRTLAGHTDAIFGLAYSPDGSRLASSSWDQSVKLWDHAAGTLLHDLRGHRDWVDGVAFSPDGTRLASASRDHTIRLWETSSGQHVRTFMGLGVGLSTVAFSPEGWRLVSAHDNGLYLWDVAGGMEVRTLRGHRARVSDVQFAPDGEWLATASGDGSLRTWDVATGQEIRAVGADSSNRYESVAINPTGTLLAGVGRTEAVRLYEPFGGQLAASMPSSPWSSFRRAVFVPNGRQLITGDDCGIVHFWDLVQPREEASIHAHGMWIEALAVSADGKLLATAGVEGKVRGQGGTVRLYDLATRAEVRMLKPLWQRSALPAAGADLPPEAMEQMPVRVIGVAFHPDGKQVATTHDEGTLRIWDVATGKELTVARGHNYSVSGLAYDPTGARLATAGGHDRNVKLWDAVSGQEVRLLDGFGQDVKAVAFSPDGTRLASACEDGTVRLYDARPMTPALAVEREALGLVDYLFSRPLPRDAVLDAVRATPLINEAVRERALALAERFPEETEPARYHRASRALLRQPHLSAVQYRHALAQARAACRLAPGHNEHRISLGIAYHRLGQHGEALSLLHSLPPGPPEAPTVLAFLAMAYHGSGDQGSALAILAGLREAVKPGDAEAAGFLKEAEALIEGRK